MSYGFGDNDEKSASSPTELKKLRLPTAKADTPSSTAVDVAAALEVGQGLGFLSRQPTSTPIVNRPRRPGPKRTEPQGKITVTGPQRVLDQLQAKSDSMGGIPYWQVIDALLRADEP
ncbi:hypothetical protein [Brucella sp. 22210]|uniref:hypothetical protein n=1 Tax=Brucella sp. 22210 TaxID=3453892 RepID=UPI003F832E67